MKSLREQMEIVHAYELVGSYRAAAALCGTTHKTVKRVLHRRQAGQGPAREPRARNTVGVQALIVEKVRASDGRISAKRLLPIAQAAGYTGSARNFRRAVAEAKAAYMQQRRVYRPWLPVPGEHLVIDWTPLPSGWQMFGAVLAWSRYRWVRYAPDQTRETTLRLLGECFAELGGVPAVVLSDRMGCLRASIVANVVVPHPDYVAFALHYGFRPDFCEGADPESKGVVEALLGYAQTDLDVPLQLQQPLADLATSNAAAVAWGREVNTRVHTEIVAIPAERLVRERAVLRPLPSARPPLRQGAVRQVDRTGLVRFGSGRYAVPDHLVGQRVEVAAEDGAIVIRQHAAEVIRHAPVAPGEVALGDLVDAHRRPVRGVRPRTATELAFLDLGSVAEAFLRAAAAAGTLRLAHELQGIVDLAAGWDRPALLRALERATRFRRFKVADVHAILLAGAGAPTPRPAGGQLMLDLPSVPTRPLSAYAFEAVS